MLHWWSRVQRLKWRATDGGSGQIGEMHIPELWGQTNILLLIVIYISLHTLLILVVLFR